MERKQSHFWLSISNIAFPQENPPVGVAILDYSWHAGWVTDGEIECVCREYFLKMSEEHQA